MVNLGQINSLNIVSFTEFGAFLDGGADGEILLPKKDLGMAESIGLEVGQPINVLIYRDTNDRLIATTTKPEAYAFEAALLTVAAIESVGIFLDWGLGKNILLPHAEQIRPLRIGESVVVYIYIDNSNRLAASMKIDKYLKNEGADYAPNEPVNLLIYDFSELGTKAIINNRHQGLLFKNETFERLFYGQTKQGYVKQVRDDDKIDLALIAAGHQATDPIADKILTLLTANKGFYPITDKTDAEKIYQLFGVSKKKFKIALGGLYKKRLILVADDGIRLNS